MLTLRSVETDFLRLAAEWRRAVDLVPTVNQMISHPTYEGIIGLGSPVVPFLLAELVDRPDHWFCALERLTECNPAEGTRTFSASVAAWLTWADEQGLSIWVPAQE